ncbi:MAG: DUF5011 domain-containing protein [Verrucomicrobia bacterium]|nr:DUF5011 domain-containing protein [Verrucomicrobiota bacterium]
MKRLALRWVWGSLTLVSLEVAKANDAVGVKANSIQPLGIAGDISPPLIQVYPRRISVPLGGKLPNVLEGVTATDDRDGILTEKVAAVGSVDVTHSGSYPIKYRANDSVGNSAEEKTRVYYVGNGLSFTANFNSFGELTELGGRVPGEQQLNQVPLAEMFDRFVELGFNSISFHPVTTLDGELGFPAPRGVNLVAKGYKDAAPPPWPDGQDRMRWAVAEAHLRGLKAFANFQAFSHVARMTSLTIPGAQPLSDSEVEALADLLVRPAAQGGYGFDGISGEVLPARWFPIVRRVTSAHGAIHMHDTDRGELGSDQALNHPPTLIWETFPQTDVLSLEDYELRRVGPNSLIVGVSRYLNRILAIRSSTFDFASAEETGGFPGTYGPETVGNIFLFRRIQSGVDWFTHFVTWTDIPEKMTVGLKNIPVTRFGELKRWPTDEANQLVFNLIIHLGRGSHFEDRYDAINRYALGALIEGATVSGLKIEASPQPISGAAAYLLLTTGQDGEGAFFDLPNSLDLLYTTAAPVFLVTLNGLPNQGGWTRLREAFGLGNVEFDTFSDSAGSAAAAPIPRTVNWKGRPVRYLERDAIARNAEVTAIELPADGTELSAKILLEGKVGSKLGALITQKGNRVFMNGSHLDADVAFILSDLLGRPARRQAPGDYWSTVGPNLSAFLGYSDRQQLEVCLPLKDGTPVSVYRRTAQGTVSEESHTYQAAAGFKTEIGLGEIIVASAERQGTQPVLSSPFWNQFGFEFKLNGPTGRVHAIEATSDFKEWITIHEFFKVTGPTNFADRNADQFQSRFYRARLRE